MKHVLLMLLALMCLSAPPLWAQPDPGDWGCGTVLTPEGADYAKRKVAEGAWSQALDTRGLPPVCIGVSCHIVRYSDGSEGIPEARVDMAIGDLNLHMAPAGLSFFRDGAFIYIDNDEYAELFSGSQRDALRQYDPVEGTMNVWFIPVLAGLCGESSFTFSQHQGIMMANDCTATSSDRATFSHEVGHYFNLFHTFETFTGVECVDGSNCSDAGDQICDTAADFGRYCNNGDTAVDGQCELACTDEDPCGSGLSYDPPIKNLMSYTTQRCTDHFSPDQLARARSVALEERDDHIVPCNLSEPGACCLNGQCIDVEAAGLCLPLGGTYMGAGTTCEDEDVICDLPGSPGACCFNSNCTNVTSVVECTDIDGIYVGYGTSCEQISCESFSPGACCDGVECTTVASVLDCEDQGGVFVGLNSNCSLISCFPGSSGACCLGIGCYEVGGVEECTYLNGTFMGIGTQCSDDPCESTMGCCVGAECIQVASLSECSDLFGTFLGDGNICDIATCTLVTSPGACCLGTECFNVAFVAVCSDAGGTFLGLGVPCSDGLCNDTDGVCCFNENCVQVGESVGGRNCLVTVDGYLGPGTTCVPDVCVTISGACCTGTNCEVVDSFFDCESNGGTFLGLGTTCANVWCDPPGSPGACCLTLPFFPPGSCVDVVTIDQCESVLGHYAGLNTSCSDPIFSCQASTGACCLGEECIGVQGVSECEDVGGIYLGVGTNCQFISCDYEISGACCFNQDTCENVTKPVSECYLQGGDFKGEGTSCEEDPSPCALTGACCIEVVCTLETPDVCQFSGGQFFGIGSECIGDPCAQESSDCLGELVLGTQSYSGGQRGNAVSTSGNLVLIGAVGEDLPTGAPDVGMVYLYEQSSEQLLGRPVAPPLAGVGQGRYQDRFGCSVSVDGLINDGIAVVGASHHDYFPGGPPDIDAGIVYVYSVLDISEADVNNNMTAVPRLIPNPIPDDYDYFGHSVDASLVGSEVRMIVGAPSADTYGPNSGTAYWFEFDQNDIDSEMTWAEIPVPDIVYNDQASVGYAVSICQSGLTTIAAIGIPDHDSEDGEDAGKICIVTPNGLGGGSNDLSFNVEVLDNPSPNWFKNLGRSVDLYYDEDTQTPYLVAGALQRSDSDDEGKGRGLARVWKYDSAAGKWEGMWPPLRPSTFPEYNNCAESVSLTIQEGVLYALIGCPQAHWNGLVAPGISVLYEYDEASRRWEELKRLWGCNQTPEDAFGYAVAMDEWIVCGAPYSLDSFEGHVYASPLVSVVNASGTGTRVIERSSPDITSSIKGLGHPDGRVDAADLMALLEHWGDCGAECAYQRCTGDLNGDCQVDALDLLFMLASWGQ